MMMLSLAWKNIWVNKKRSWIIVAATTIGLTASVFYGGVINGMYDSMIASAIDREFGNLQVHSEEYKKDPDLHKFLADPGPLLQKLQNHPNVRSAVTHCLLEGMASSATVSSGVALIAVDPREEQEVTSISRSLLEGTYLEKPNTLVMGKKLADKLKLKVRSRVVLSFAGPDGNIIYGAFRISGIFRTDGSQFDASTVFIRQQDLASLLGTTGVPVHEVVIRVNDPLSAERTRDELQRQFSPEIRVETWGDLAPELKLGADSSAIINAVMLGIILTALLFGLTNTLLMSVLDRVRDFGILLAIGMVRRRLFTMIILESILLSFTGGILGTLAGWSLTTYYHAHGIDLSAFSAGLSAYGMPSWLYPTLRLSSLIPLAVMMVCTSVIAALYPAIKAVRLKPVDAIRTIP